MLDVLPRRYDCRVIPEAQATERYACAVGELWNGLARTLERLEALAAIPERLAAERELDELRLLQYRLHSAGEHAVGLAPPAAAASDHGELAAALLDARDATGELAEALEGRGALGARVYEWRGALFRVRMARLRLAEPRRPPAAEPEEPSGFSAPAVALALTLVGAAAFGVGATLGPWPLWALGAIALCSSVLVYRP
jgi:hypothetical protein